MRYLFVILFLLALGLYWGDGQYFDLGIRQALSTPSNPVMEIEWSDQQKGKKSYGVSVIPSNRSRTSTIINDGIYRCDGRQYCAQMHSCAEAVYFLQNCPDVKMDGDKDGIPCEEQWCGRS